MNYNLELFIERYPENDRGKFFNAVLEELKENNITYFEVPLSNHPIIDHLFTYSNFLNKIPTHEIRDIAYKIIQEILKYIALNDSAQIQQSISVNVGRKEDKKPSIRIKQDLKKIEDFKKLLLKSVKIEHYKNDEFRNAIFYVEKMKFDLINNQFEIMDEHSYYKYKKYSKNNLRELLINVSTQHHLKDSQLHIKSFIDNLPY